MPKRLRLDLNCDLGEGEPATRTREFMQRISSANVACGGHAGDLESMERCVRWCHRFGVHLGAHPGLPGGADFGRGARDVSRGDLQMLLLQQVGALQSVARANGVRLHHVKLHGALYHLVETVPSLREAYLATVGRFWPRLIIYARAGGKVAARAGSLGMQVWEEGFLDRGYSDDGGLLPRDHKDAVITDADQVSDRVHELAHGRGVTSVNGRRIAIRPRTVCLHSDTPDAVILVRAASRTLGMRPSPRSRVSI